ncbi:cell division protein ZapB [Candidatus Nitronereus thalassa]|uniref:Cell division protein ZapB n=1 Tax=Candidatus Nitronereus thalassa TaxID=3020898 RepID=A0ABU3KA55_9BACT|nr:cell division protein ZapB [Candidatus Nitronereus thalassa]MDT7043325.1 cell division protein ZapB [Candidatus Nitronereus thalassa]
MSLEKLEALEVRVQRLVDMVQHLKQANGLLQEELGRAQERLVQQEAHSQDWEEERTHIRAKIEKVLDNLQFLETPDHELQGVTHDERY